MATRTRWSPPDIPLRHGGEIVPGSGWQLFDKLLASQLTLEELSSIFNVCEDVIELAVRRHIKEQRLEATLRKHFELPVQGAGRSRSLTFAHYSAWKKQGGYGHVRRVLYEKAVG